MRKLVATLAVSAVLFSGCGLKQEAVIKINDKVITKAEDLKSGMEVDLRFQDGNAKAKVI